MDLIRRAVKFTSKLFGRALSRRIKATILFATETGKSEQYAKQLGELLSHAFNAQVTIVISGVFSAKYESRDGESGCYDAICDTNNHHKDVGTGILLVDSLSLILCCTKDA